MMTVLLLHYMENNYYSTIFHLRSPGGLPTGTCSQSPSMADTGSATAGDGKRHFIENGRWEGKVGCCFHYATLSVCYAIALARAEGIIASRR